MSGHKNRNARRPHRDERRGDTSLWTEDVRRLTFIRRCRNFGFTIERVRLLVSLEQDRTRSCLEARDLTQLYLEEIRAKL